MEREGKGKEVRKEEREGDKGVKRGRRWGRGKGGHLGLCEVHLPCSDFEEGEGTLPWGNVMRGPDLCG